jgi:Cdc6-like AAA superfamily ATPase
MIINEQTERIKSILKNNWIGYPKSELVLKHLNQLLLFPKSHRMQNLLIIGESNNGKTTIARRFLHQNPSFISSDIDIDTGLMIDYVVRPVVMIQCPHVPEEKRLYFNILEQLNIPFRKTAKSDYLNEIVIQALIDMKVKVLILDEIHHILSGSPRKQREFLALIKYISNIAEVSLVGIGTNEANYALKSDDQLSTRFDKIIIPNWQYDNDFIRLIATLEKVIKLTKESKLIEPKISKEIYNMSKGNLGEILKIVKLSAIEAIESTDEKISIDTLKRISYQSPFSN